MAVPIKSTANFDCYLMSQRVSCGDIGSSNEILETWIIVIKEAGIVRPETSDWKNLILENAAPEIGEYYSAWWGGGAAYTGAPWQTKARCRNHDFVTLEDGRIQATFRFQTYYFPDPNTRATTNKLHLPTLIECQHSTRTTALFKRTWTTDPDPIVDSSAADIGGVAAILGTKDPMEAQVPQTRIRVRLTMDAEDIQIYDAMQTMEQIVGKRNSSVFLSFYSEGKVYCESFAINKLEGEFYEITVDFLFDAYYEHDQYPEIASDGIPKTNNTGTQFTDIRWKRVERASVDLNTIFAYTGPNFGVTADVDRKALGLKGYWA